MLVARSYPIRLTLLGFFSLLSLAACQLIQTPEPTALPTLPPPTLLAEKATDTAAPNTPTPKPIAPPTQTVAPSTTPSVTASPNVTALFSTTVEAGGTVTAPITQTEGSALNATPTATPCFGTLVGQVIADLNANGQVDANEPGLMGATLMLKNSTMIGFYVTGDGQFSFPGLLAGTYVLSESPPNGYTSADSTLVDVTVTCGATVTQNFLNVPLTPSPTPTALTDTGAATPVAGGSPGPRSGVKGFTPFSPGPVSYVSGCGSINAPGTYLLTQSLTSEWDCMQIFSDNVTFDCQGNSLDGTDGNGYGIVVHHTSPVLGRRVRNIEIRNCKMTAHRYGIFVDASENLYIHDNNTSGNFTDTDKRNYGIFLGLVEGGGIRVNDTLGAQISNNRSDGMQAIGIDVRQSDGVLVSNNTTNGNSAWGIQLYGVIYSEVSSNTSTNNIRYCTWGSGVVGAGCDAGGIMMQGGSSFNVVKNNMISGNNGNGIFIKAHDEPCGDNNTIANNRIAGALYNAIELSFCKNNKLQGNEISNSLDAIWMGFTTNTQINGGNYLHDMTNHGVISWNSQDNNISSNRIVNSREGLYFYSSTYKKDEFFFVPGEPSDHFSRGNCLCSNTLASNATAAFHLNDSIKNQVTGNTLTNNGKNFLMEGNTSGNIIENNSIQGGAYRLGTGADQVSFTDARPAALSVYDLSGNLLSRGQLLRALTLSSPSDSFDLRWFKYKMRVSLGLPADSLPDRAPWLGFFGLPHAY